MTDLRTAAQQALEALENSIEYDYHGNPIDKENADLIKSAENLRAALAEPVQEPEPVAWYLPSPDGDDSIFRDHRTVKVCTGNKWEGFQPLFTAPPQRPAEPVQEQDLSRCPKCGGPADNGHDRCVPPNAYHCTACDQADELTMAYMLGARRRLTVEDLQQALIETDLIDPDAIDDPEMYDNGYTAAQINELHGKLTA